MPVESWKLSKLVGPPGPSYLMVLPAFSAAAPWANEYTTVAPGTPFPILMMSGPYTLGLVLFDMIMARAARLIPSYRCTPPGALRYVVKLPVVPGTLPCWARSAAENAWNAGPLVSVTRLSAWKSDANVPAPTAAAAALKNGGEMAPDVPMTGIILPPLSCWISENRVGSAGPRASVMIASGWDWTIASASVRNVVAFRSSVWSVARVIPAFFSAPMAGWTKVCEPMSLPKARAILV